MDLLMSYKLQNNLQPFQKIIEKKKEHIVCNHVKKQHTIMLQRDISCTKCGQSLHWCCCNIFTGSKEIPSS